MAKETANNGFIKLHRSFRDWQHYGELSVMVVFIDLLLSVNHKDGWWRGHKCERGATFASIRTIAYSTKLTEKTVHKALKTLELTGEIKRIRIDQKNTKTIILKYNDYQDNSLISVVNSNTQSNTQTTTQSTTKQERKEREEYQHRQEDKKTHTHEEILNWLVNSQYLEQFAMTEGITTELCKKLANDAVMEWKMLGTTHRSVTDARKHLLDRIRKQVGVMRSNGTLTANDDVNKRLKPLIDDCNVLIDEGNSREDVREFYSYWTQTTNDGTGRMLFEAQPAWNTRTRYVKHLNKKK